jgi:hypothetical protein
MGFLGFTSIPPIMVIHIQPLRGWHFLHILPRVSPAAIHIEPLRGYFKTGSYFVIVPNHILINSVVLLLGDIDLFIGFQDLS